MHKHGFATWEDGFEAFYKPIWCGYVKGQMTPSIAGHPCLTVLEIIPVYAPCVEHAMTV
jgi:hypothetical protein